MSKTKKTSQEIVQYTEAEQAYLDSLKSEESSTSEYSGPPRLTINTKGKDDEGNKIPIGGWHIQGTDIYFDGPVYFRPVRKYNKLIRYSVDNGKYSVAGQSIYYPFPTPVKSILDSLGGYALGRTFSKNLSKEQIKAEQELAQCYLDIFGFARFDGEEEGHPVIYRVRGKKIMFMDEAFRAIPRGKNFSEFEYKIVTDQADTGYWTIEVTPEVSTPLPLTPILEYDKVVQDFVAEENRKVVAAFKQANDALVDDAFIDANSTTIAVEDDDDDLPF